VADSLSAIKPKLFQSSVGKNLNELKAVKQKRYLTYVRDDTVSGLFTASILVMKIL